MQLIGLGDLAPIEPQVSRQRRIGGRAERGPVPVHGRIPMQTPAVLDQVPVAGGASGGDQFGDEGVEVAVEGLAAASAGRPSPG